jgi:hypothetical protein
MIFRNKLDFYGEGLLVPSPIPKLDDQPLSFFYSCLFNILSRTRAGYVNHKNVD